MSEYSRRYYQIHRDLIKQLADRLYIIGKSEASQEGAPWVRVKFELIDLAKSMYKVSEKPLVSITEEELSGWSSTLSQILEKTQVDERNSQIYREIEGIQKRVQNWLGEFEALKEPTDQGLDMLTSTSVLLGFTLWFGGNNFSLSYEQLSSELAFAHNQAIELAFKRLKNSAFAELENKLIVLNPRYSSYVDRAILYLIGLGANFKVGAPPFHKQQYLTIQEGFLILTGNKVHPMVPLFENVRGYISDYCQRFFGRICEELESKESKFHYNMLRRFVARLSLLPLNSFVVSRDERLESIVKKLEALNIIAKLNTIDSREVLLVNKEVLKY